jgi:uncharacterized protein (DUF2345 family)
MNKIILFILWLFYGAAPDHAGLAAGVAAMDRGDFTAAMKDLKPLAEQGDVNVQAQMGYL